MEVIPPAKAVPRAKTNPLRFQPGELLHEIAGEESIGRNAGIKQRLLKTLAGSKASGSRTSSTPSMPRRRPPSASDIPHGNI